MYLESWLHKIIANSGIVRPGAPVTRVDVQAYHDQKLREAIRYCNAKSSFYRDIFRAAAVNPEDIRSTRDLIRLPFTEQQHISESPFRFLCTSQAEVARPYTFVTSGTTGPKKRIFWTQRDLDRIIDFMSAGIGTVAGDGDTVLILLPDGKPYSQADLLHRAVKKIGAIPVVAAMDLDARELLQTIEDTRCAVVFGYTRKLFRLTREIQALPETGAKGVRIFFLAAEYLPDAMRREFQKTWGCGVRTHYGLTEMGLGVAVECEAGDGYHFNEADLLLEVINPQTGAPVSDGEEGELVFTTLNREAMPLIRYRTHDLSRLLPESCPCGAHSLLKIDKVKKRLENMIRIGGGDAMYPSLFDDVLFEIPGLVDYQVTVATEGGKDRLDFRLEILRDRAQIPEITAALLAAPIISKNLSIGRMAPPTVELSAPGSLQSVRREKKMILDHR